MTLYMDNTCIHGYMGLYNKPQSHNIYLEKKNDVTVLHEKTSIFSHGLEMVEQEIGTLQMKILRLPLERGNIPLHKKIT